MPKPIQPDFRNPSEPVGFNWTETQDVRAAAIALHELGPRVLYELLLDMGRDQTKVGRAAMLARIRAYSRINRETLVALGADQFPATPTLREVK